jgi:hypothetical protein
VPETNTGIGNITVSATGFNVSCGFYEDLNVNFSVDTSQWDLSQGDTNLPAIESTRTLFARLVPVFLIILQHPV